MSAIDYYTPEADALARRDDLMWSTSEEGEDLGASIEDTIGTAINCLGSADDTEVYVFGFRQVPWSEKQIGRLAADAWDAVRERVWEEYAEDAVNHVLDRDPAAAEFRAAVKVVTDALGPMWVYEYEIKVDVGRWIAEHPE